MDFTINEMLAMQTALQEKYKDIWEGVSPEVGQNKILWMIGEIGEVIDVVKENGWEEATQNLDHRKELVEELADVLMYYNDVLLCYGITAEELKKSLYRKIPAQYDPLVRKGEHKWRVKKKQSSPTCAWSTTIRATSWWRTAASRSGPASPSRAAMWSTGSPLWPQ